jgi:hypothetical protein
MKKSWNKALSWLDNNILFVLAGFLLAFIPLWPKIPLFSPIEQYIVRVRAEDFFLFIAGIIWLIQVIRGKIKWLSPMFWFVVAYAVVGLASILGAMFVIKSIPLQPLHVGKSFLHYFRYLEYFSFFFIVFSSIKKRSQALILIGISIATVLAIGIYGYGQKYFYWPVYSTMNREFSKGIRLYLTEHARVQSTFGGHYDMAAYLVVVLPIVLALAYQVKNKAISTGLHWTFWLGTWLLILSASRTPFVAFFVGVLGVIALTAWFQKSWVASFTFAFTRTLVTLLLTGVLFFYFGADMSERLSHVVSSNPTLQSAVDGFNDQRKMIISDEKLAQLPLSPQQLNAWLPKGTPPGTGISTDDVAAAAEAAKEVASISDIPPLPFHQTKATPSPKPSPVVLPKGVYQDIPDIEEVATVAADGTVTVTQVKKKRVYSECSLKKELSLCIRLESLWPRALEGFLTNPATGYGYATLTKEEVDQFTEADSTDNNFLRTLGETGLLGFITFYGCVALALWFALKNVNNKDRLAAGLSIGFLCGTVGLLFNAIYIDVFAASKVALTYWGLAGLLIGYISASSYDKAE